MTISLSGIENNRKLRIVFNEPVEVSQEYGLIDCLPVIKFEGTIRKSDDEFLLEGSLESNILLSCGKCLQNVSVSLSSPVFERLSNKRVSALSDASDNEEIWHVQSLSSVDIAPQILLNLQLLIPMNVLCKDECRGICRYCGGNLNETSCNCDELNREIDPRLEKLRALI